MEVLEAQVDAGPFVPVAFDAAGDFRFDTALPTDGTADGLALGPPEGCGPRRQRFEAVGRLLPAGYDRPRGGHHESVADLSTNANVIVTGRVTDHFLGVASLHAQVDQGPFADVGFDASGTFSIPITLPLDGSADGGHTVRFQAIDAVGNVSSFVSVAFTLDSTAPLVVILNPTRTR